MRLRRVVDLRFMGVPEVTVLGHYENRQAQRAITRHTHPDSMEICFLESGRQLYRVRGANYALAGGDLFVTFPGESHSTGNTPQEIGQLYWIQVRLPRRRQYFLGLDPDLSDVIVTRLRELPHRHFAGSKRVLLLFRSLFEATAGHEAAMRTLTLRTRLIDLLLEVIHLSKSKPRRETTQAIDRLLAYIDANSHRRLSIGELASRMGLSPCRFQARFRAELGMPPAQYVLSRRVAEARRRLLQPNASITRVAQDLGFASSQYFATVFRRYTRQRPREFLPQR